MAQQREFTRSLRSPRYSTYRSPGFQGGSSDAVGNISPPTATAAAGSADISSASSRTQQSQGTGNPQQPAIANFSASSPRPASLASQFGRAAVGQAAGSVLKSTANKAIDTIGKGIGNATAGPDYGGDAIPSSVDYPVTAADYSAANAASAPEVSAPEVVVPDVSAPADVGSVGIDSEVQGNVGDIASGIGDAADIYGGTAGAVGIASEVAGNVGDIAGGAADAADAASAADGANFGVPLGAVARLAQGDVGGAVKNAAGYYVGQAIGSVFGPVGTAVGGFLGGLVGNACFITEAVMSQQGMSDNSEPLMVLRAFRDNIMMQTPEGQAMVQEYEQIAPLIVEAIGARPDAMQIFQQIYSEFLAPAVESIKAGEYKGALEIYAKMIAFAASFSEEVMQQDQEAGAMVSDFGDHAASVGQNDDLTASIAQQGVGDSDWMQNDQMHSSAPAGVQPHGMPAIAQMGVPRRY